MFGRKPSEAEIAAAEASRAQREEYDRVFNSQMASGPRPISRTRTEQLFYRMSAFIAKLSEQKGRYDPGDELELHQIASELNGKDGDYVLAAGLTETTSRDMNWPFGYTDPKDYQWSCLVQHTLAGIKKGRELAVEMMMGQPHPDPTPEMIEAGMRAVMDQAVQPPDILRKSVEIVWRAMAAKAIGMVEVSIEEMANRLNDPELRDFMGTPTIYAVWPKRR